MGYSCSECIKRAYRLRQSYYLSSVIARAKLRGAGGARRAGRAGEGE